MGAPEIKAAHRDQKVDEPRAAAYTWPRYFGMAVHLDMLWLTFVCQGHRPQFPGHQRQMFLFRRCGKQCVESRTESENCNKTSVAKWSVQVTAFLVKYRYM